MSIFVPGAPCILCDLPMERDVVQFSAFIANRMDPLFFLNDATVHATCLRNHPLADQARRWQDEASRQGKAASRICGVCSNPITAPDDYFATGLLASDAANPLHAFNFIHLHRSHAHHWQHFDQLLRSMQAASASGAWVGPTLVSDSPGGVRWIAPCS